MAALAGKTLILTGAAGEIGRATARALASAGARLLLTDRLESVEAGLTELAGDGHAAIAGDLTDPGFCAELVARAGELDGPDGLVHAAGILRPQALEEVTVEEWDLTYEVNVRASFLICREAGTAMAERGRGSVVIFASGCWQYGGLPERVAYCSSKGAVVTMSRALARAMGPRGVTVNCIAPGLIESPMMSSALSDSKRAELEAAVPLRRFGEPAEVAAVAVFLSSDAASYVSGATINVSGGYVLH